ncbi:hypothetical protein GO755_35090 [Spirosoma sp. HMF4905]|uniref:YD repeat-containing protein n=1 Tax=Spirosoma arboris TaxID=2682092 RepID=A0A7K1SNF0_9BACT|nr:hypothetical protein [Spirosoma arboris]MVM35301.1 hypothetical protein [Spirosoma arboris]
MKTIFRYCILFLFGSLALSCTDHRLRPLDSQQMRLKTSNNINFGGFPFSTTYTYDAMNRVAFFTTSIGSQGTFQYDAQGRYRLFDYFPNAADTKNGDETSFTYNTNNNNVVVYTGGLFNGSYTSTRETLFYMADANKRFTSYNNGQSSSFAGEDFYYTGENITRIDVRSGHSVETFLYEYDTNPNPYYGLIAPDISSVRRFSRNNVIKITNQTTGKVNAVYTYTYNELGLPTTLQNVTGSGQIQYTYESY